MYSRNKLKSIVFLCFIVVANATLAPPKKGERTKTTKEIKLNAGPVNQNVIDRNLIEDEPFAKDIITESGTYYKDTKNRLFPGPTLGFVTPVSLTQHHKIDFYVKINGCAILYSGITMVTTWPKSSELNSI